MHYLLLKLLLLNSSILRGNIRFAYLLTCIFEGAKAAINKCTDYKTLSLSLKAK